MHTRTGRTVVASSIVALAICATSALTATAQSPHPTPSIDPNEPWLVYQWYPGVLYVVRPDGTDRTAITTGIRGEPFAPSWSADGERLAFVIRNDDTPNGSIWTADLDGGHAELLYGGSGECNDGAFWPVWAPDGRNLALLCYQTNATATQAATVAWGYISVLDTTTMTRRDLARFTYPDTVDNPPSWSPDGTQLTFEIITWDPTDTFLSGSVIATVPVAGGDVQRLTDPTLFGGHPDWSPDGSRIVFNTYDTGNMHQIQEASNLYAIAPDGTDLRQLSSASVDGTMRIGQPFWSSDGSRVWVSVAREFERDQYGWIKNTLGWVDADTGELHEIGTEGKRFREQPALPAMAADPSSPPATPSSPPATDARTTWAADLATIDEQVRTLHPDPFAINPESAWVAKLEELRETLPGATRDEQIVQLSSLVGLLDSHSWLDGPIHLYPVWTYRFPEGWFVVRAEDPTLVGTRLVSIDGTPVERIEEALRPLVPSDNESGELIGLQDRLATVEILHGLGIVQDPDAATFVFESGNGNPRIETMAPVRWDSEWAAGLIGYLVGDATEAVARRASPMWGSLQADRKAFLIGYNDYTVNRLAPVIGDMRAALDAGTADRVVFDMRYLMGGNANVGLSLIDILKADERIARPGGLTVLIGRENQSAGTVVAGAFDRDTEALLIGEPTPARADNFLCSCTDIRLQSTDFVVTIPTAYLANGDPRDAVMPDITVELTAADFFAGRDPALELALSGGLPDPTSSLVP